jgi:hypothetical protein
MPREQETSLPHDPATSDDPLFREPSGQYRDGTAAGDRDETATGETPIGDELSAGRHATPRDGEPLPADTMTNAPGEWVAGSKGPGYTSADDTVDTAESTGTTESTDTAGATGTAADLRTTRDPAVAPDSALATEPEMATGTEPTRADTTEPTRADTTPPSTGATTLADTTPADTTRADTTHNGTAPATTGTPVPGAPGTAETTGVDVAAAAFVTNGEELHADWARIQSSFVDDPRQAVSQAADLVGQVTSSLVTAVQEREQTLRGSWETQTQDGTDTEHLRNALRDYRAFFELLVKL